MAAWRCVAHGGELRALGAVITVEDVLDSLPCFECCSYAHSGLWFAQESVCQYLHVRRAPKKLTQGTPSVYSGCKEVIEALSKDPAKCNKVKLLPYDVVYRFLSEVRGIRTEGDMDDASDMETDQAQSEGTVDAAGAILAALRDIDTRQVIREHEMRTRWQHYVFQESLGAVLVTAAAKDPQRYSGLLQFLPDFSLPEQGQFEPYTGMDWEDLWKYLTLIAPTLGPEWVQTVREHIEVSS